MKLRSYDNRLRLFLNLVYKRRVCHLLSLVTVLAMCMLTTACGSAVALATEAKPVPTLSFPDVGTQTLGVGAFSVKAVSNSSGSITYSVVSGPATVSGYSATVTGVGTVVIQASQAATPDYAAATATTSFSVVAKPVPTLSFPDVGTQTLGVGAFSVKAVSNSSGSITYSVVSGPATVSGYSATVTGVGTVVIQASQAATPDYAAATATTSFSVVAKPVPTLSFPDIGTQTLGVGAFSVKAVSNSSGSITYSVVSGPATVSGYSATVTGVGTVVIQASQAATPDYAAATATTSFSVVAKPVPTLSFPDIGTQTLGVGAFSVKAVSNSSGSITYSVVSGPATVSGYSATVTGVGTVVIQASQAATPDYAAATATTSFSVVAKPVPTLSFPDVGTQTLGVGAFSVKAVSNSSGSITYSVVSGPATVSGYSATVTGVGTVVIQASQAATPDYAAATATTSFSVVAKPVPTLSFPDVGTQTLGVGAFSVKAVSNSSGSITYSVVSGPATVSGYSATVTGVGTVVIQASQAATPDYAAATATTSFSVVAKPVPTLSFPDVGTQTLGVGAFSVKAVSNSSGSITYSVVSGPATVSGYSATVTGVGTVVIQASQAATPDYAAATATTSFSVVAKPVPTLSFPDIGTQTLGVGAFSVKAVSNSSGSITYSVVSGPATVSGYSATVTGVGTVVIQASQAATPDYAAATATTSFSVVAKPVPTLSFPDVGTQTLGVGAFSVKAVSNSSGSITYSVVSGPATVSGYSATVTGVGTVVIQASQAATPDYAAATATTSFSVVAKPVPTLSFPDIGTQTLGVGAFSVKAVSNSSGSITYSVVSGPATVSGYSATVTGVGTVVIQASQAATPDYAAATATTSFSVVAKAVAFGQIPAKSYGCSPFTVTATSLSSGAITYSLVSGPATILGSTVSIDGAGIVVLAASQAAAGIYPASSTTTSINIAPQVATLSFASIAAQTMGNAPFQVNASSASNGPISYLVVSGPATINGSTVTITGIGSVLLSATQAATTNYAQASTTAAFTVSASAGPTPAGAAARLLDQSTFGPTLSTIAHVQAVGLDGYLQEQFALPPTTIPSFSASTPLPSCTAANLYNCVQSEWWNGILNGPDQLRQRVAFALSEIFVVSNHDGIDWMSIPQFQNVLINDAFANYQTLLKDVALSPAMGGYLNMLNSAAPANGQIANENFAREMMQLFTTGENLLNQDGSLQLDENGAALPAYTEDQVQAFARAYTGWTYATAGEGVPGTFPNRTPNYTVPMVAVENAHDTTSKTLLNNTVLQGGQTAEQDLAGAISNVFNHPNVGPFVCRQLIQHLVKSDPSPAYISRVASVFADNGAGVRGDLQAVVRAILTDEEARSGDTTPVPSDGHQREPILFITGAVRGLGMTNGDSTGSYRALSIDTFTLNQQPFSALSVFNFFPSDYMLPGTSTNAPEFGLENTSQVAIRLSMADSFVGNYANQMIKVDLSATSPLGSLASDPATLVDTLSTLFMHAQMPDQVRSTIVDAITPLSSNAQRARVAVYLVLSSPQYNVIQ